MMTDLRDVEDELRAVMRSAADSARPPADLADRLIGGASTEGVPTQAGDSLGADVRPPRSGRRPWLVPAVSAAAVIIVVIGIAVGVAEVRGTRHASTATITPSRIVPWDGSGVHPIAPSNLTSRRAVAAPAGTRDCNSVDFALVFARSAPTADGWVTTTYLLRSIASSDCAEYNSYSLPTLVDNAGTMLPNDAGMPTGPAPFPDRLLVQPGDLLSGDVYWARVKGLAPDPARLVLFGNDTASSTPDAGLSIPLTRIAAPFHPTTTNSGPWRAGSIAPPPHVFRPGSLDSLVAVLHAPPMVGQATVLRYSVELQNHTDVPVRLSPCPDFVEQVLVITAKDKPVTSWGGPLNCAQAPNAIAPYSSVSFAFELDTTTLAAGTRYLTWSLAVGDQIFTSTGPSADITGKR
jgi:hypothetical protein